MQFDSFRMVKEGFYTNGISNHKATEKQQYFVSLRKPLTNYLRTMKI